MAVLIKNGPANMRAITIQVLAISSILDSPPDRCDLSTKPHRVKNAPKPVKIHPMPPRTDGFPAAPWARPRKRTLPS